MAGKTATVLARVDPELKMKAEDILDRLGVPASLLINMLYRQIVMTKSIPFDIRIPMDSGEFCIEPPTGE
jgi:addiction module RelB/DinJ family antitoxin